MNIHIIGGGAVGLFFAAQWCEKHAVTLWTRTEQQAEMISRGGIRVLENHMENIYPVNSKKIESLYVEGDLVVVAVKQYHMKEVLPLLQNAAAQSVLFLQNGMSHLDFLEQVPHPHLYAASVEHGLAKIDGRTIQVNGRNKTNIGSLRSGTAGIIDQLQTGSFRFDWNENSYHMLIEKMAANAIINPLTALLKVKNGEIAENARFRAIAKDLSREFASVFSYKTAEDTFQSVLSICTKTADNESSMLKDMKAGNLTEIDAIVGVLLKTAEKNHRSVPAFQLLYNMIKGKENTPEFMSK
ncbi:hypothetical protein BTO30_08115 [Domibacillus antri]|uniref:2-dehydropantoate 2-reductase n=1 Tax=Domibacillus antri TaxID=1714264 RepID=A0A1Q8Q6F7_9BACI|nr:2-dehydropantoate 2-reductase [Domibacillus antri]OLN22875.1 hypothetical protein BTO30_08115 [Domibacillus antri]